MRGRNPYASMMNRTPGCRSPRQDERDRRPQRHPGSGHRSSTCAWTSPALLRQASDFEGSVAVGVYREAHDPPITKGPDVEEAVPHLGVGPSHPPAIADDVDHPLLVGVDHLFDLDAVGLERLPVLAHSFLCRVKSQDFDNVRPELRVVELIVRVEQLPGYLQARVHAFVDPANCLDVLLRHRPCSISRLLKSFLMEPAGFEPAAFALQTRRSTN